MTKKELKNIYSKLKIALENRDISIANYYVTGLKDSNISDIICSLRLNGYDIKLPLTTTNYTAYNYELLAEVIRQLHVYLHPVRYWFNNNWIQLALLSCSVGALIISIIALLN